MCLLHSFRVLKESIIDSTPNQFSRPYFRKVELKPDSGADPPEQASVPGTVITTMITARMTLAIALIVPRKL